jgi:hypothetical protein
MRSPDYRLTCCDCDQEWIGPVTEEYEVRCPECNSDDIWIGSQYRPFHIESFWIVLLIPNLLLFWSGL